MVMIYKHTKMKADFGMNKQYGDYPNETCFYVAVCAWLKHVCVLGSRGVAEQPCRSLNHCPWQGWREQKQNRGNGWPIQFLQVARAGVAKHEFATDGWAVVPSTAVANPATVHPKSSSRYVQPAVGLPSICSREEQNLRLWTASRSAEQGAVRLEFGRRSRRQHVEREIVEEVVGGVLTVQLLHTHPKSIQTCFLGSAEELGQELHEETHDPVLPDAQNSTVHPASTKNVRP